MAAFSFPNTGGAAVSRCTLTPMPPWVALSNAPVGNMGRRTKWLDRVDYSVRHTPVKRRSWFPRAIASRAFLRPKWVLGPS